MGSRGYDRHHDCAGASHLAAHDRLDGHDWPDETRRGPEASR